MSALHKAVISSLRGHMKVPNTSALMLGAGCECLPAAVLHVHSLLMLPA